jgi:hypothetical protein
MFWPGLAGAIEVASPFTAGRVDVEHQQECRCYLGLAEALSLAE